MKAWPFLASVTAVWLLAGALPPANAQDNVNAVRDDVRGVFQTDSPRRNQPEPTIAIDPRNPRVVAAGAQDFRRARELRAACGGDRWNGLYLSADAGRTWTNSLVPGYCTDATRGAGSEQAVSDMFGLSTNTDPVLVFDPFGNLYYSHVAFNADAFATTPPSASGVLYVSTYRVSLTGTATYAKTVKVPSGSGLRKAPFEIGPGINANFDDKQWMAADRSPSSPFYGRVYVTWTKFGAQGGESSIWLSSCGGGPGGRVCDAFGRGHVLNTPVAGGLVQESFPVTAPDGTLYVAFLQFQGGFGSTLPQSGIWVLRSDDGGETSAAQVKVADLRQIPSPIPPAGTAANDGLNSFRTGTVPSVAVTSDGTVHVVWGAWAEGPAGPHAEVLYSRSSDRGETWSEPVPVNDVATGHQFFPSAVAEAGTVHVAWYDGRLDPPGGGISALDVFYTRLVGGRAEPNRRITTRSFDPNEVSRFPVFCAAFIGDYLDVDASGGTVAIVWNDNRKVGQPLSPGECADFIGRSTDPAIQGRLDDGSLDQEAFVTVFEP